MTNFRVLVVEDELEIQKALGSFLTREGYDVLAVNSGEAALEKLAAFGPHLILLDIMLPKISGAQVLSLIRKQSDVPVIIISALGDEAIQADLYASRADDYVVKPFSMQVLTYKIAALLRRTYQSVPDQLTAGDITLDIKRRRVTKAHHEVPLTPKEFEILQILMENKGVVYSRESLFNIVWGYGHIGELRNVDVHIANLRKKLSSTIIKTVNSIGYRVD